MKCPDKTTTSCPKSELHRRSTQGNKHSTFARAEYYHGSSKLDLQCALGALCTALAEILVFVSKHFIDCETPHSTSFLGHLLPKGEGNGFPPLSRGEKVSASRRTGEVLLTFCCGSAALCHWGTVFSVPRLVAHFASQVDAEGQYRSI